MRIDPLGNAWWHWVIGAVIVIALGIALIASGGSLAYVGVALASAANGIAFGTVATTMLSFAFLSCATIYTEDLIYNGLNIATSEIRGSIYQDAINDMDSIGKEVLGLIIGAGILSAIGGYVAWDDQLRGLGHSWSKERSDYWKKEAKNSNSDFYLNDNALKGKSPNGIALHHPYGRSGANIRYYYPVTVEEHRTIHKLLGYDNGQGGFWQYREFIDIWKMISNLF